MTAREEFEAAMQKLGASIDRSKPADAMAGIDYQWDDTEFMWYGFKLGRAAALEEAAKECDRLSMHRGEMGQHEASEEAEACADAIRELEEGE